MKKLLILVIGLALASTANALVFTDNFDHAMNADWGRVDYQAWYMQNVLAQPYPGGARVLGTGWDSYQSLPVDGVSPTIQAAPYVNAFNAGMGEASKLQPWYPGDDPAGEYCNGVLRMVSSGSAWADQDNSGPFLYINATGDFVAQVEVVGQDQFWNNLGGLMARAPNAGGDGANENWVYLTYFPVWNVGNHMRDTVNGASNEMGIKGYPCDPYLQLSRVGNMFYFKTSPDGITWTDLPDMEGGWERTDLPSTLQVGIFQANYTTDWTGTMEFDNFSLNYEIPEPATICLLGLGALALIRKRS